MNIATLNRSIAKQKRDIKNTERNIRLLLSRNPEAVKRFNNAVKTLAVDRKQTTGLGASHDTPWYENSFVTKLMDIGTTQLSAKNEQKTLQIQLDTVAQQNAALDKQLSLQARLSQAGRNASMFGGSFFDELMNSPIKLAAIAGLGFAFFKMRGKR